MVNIYKPICFCNAAVSPQIINTKEIRQKCQATNLNDYQRMPTLTF